MNQIGSILSYFHKSGLRMSELKKLAEENKLPVLVIPKLFTIRWTEFSYAMLSSLLRSWRVLMLYFDANKTDDATAFGFFKFLSNLENLQAICFLTDLLQIYSRHHKKMQDDSLTIATLVQSNRLLRSSLMSMKQKQLLAGWEETLENEIEKNGENLILKGFELMSIVIDETRRAK